MNRAIIVAISALALLGSGIAVAASPAQSCPRFIVGRANSTAYPGFQLPARGRASGVSCATLRRIARRLHNGTYVPGAGAQAPAYGPPFPVRDHGRTWSCRLQHIGGSGPTYAVRCASGPARLRWRAG